MMNDKKMCEIIIAPIKDTFDFENFSHQLRIGVPIEYDEDEAKNAIKKHCLGDVYEILDFKWIN